MPRHARIGTAARPGQTAVPGIRFGGLADGLVVRCRRLPEGRRVVLRRKTGIQLYFDGATEAAIREACGLAAHTSIASSGERCRAQNPDSNLNGWRGAPRIAR